MKTPLGSGHGKDWVIILPNWTGATVNNPFAVEKIWGGII